MQAHFPTKREIRGSQPSKKGYMAVYVCFCTKSVFFDSVVDLTKKTTVYSYGKRWKFMQHLYNTLWKRWKEEYLVHLHRRVKWRSQQRNTLSGDIVLLKEDDIFSRGRVIKVYPGPDGLVRTVNLLVNGKAYRRPICKLVHLLGKDLC